MSDESGFRARLKKGLSSVGKGAGSPGGNNSTTAAMTYNQLEAEVKTLSAQLETVLKSEAEVKEQCQQLGLQKSLLENLIDKFGDDEVADEDADDENSGVVVPKSDSEKLRSEVIRLIAENSKLTVDLKDMTSQYTETEVQRVDAERRSEAFMRAVENANNELLSSETDAKDFKGKAEDAEEAKHKVARLTAELESTHMTVEALMARVSKMDTQKEDLNAVIGKLEAELIVLRPVAPAATPSAGEEDDALVMVEEHDMDQDESSTTISASPSVGAVAVAAAPSLEMVAEVAKLTEDLNFSQQQLSAKKNELAVVNKKLVDLQLTTKASEDQSKTELDLVRDELNNVMTLHAETKQEYKEIVETKEFKIRELQDLNNSTLGSQAVTQGNMKTRIVELEAEVSKLTVASQELELSIEAKDKEIEHFKAQFESERRKHEETKLCTQEALEQSKRQIDDLEESHLEINTEMDVLRGERMPELQCEISTLEDKLAAETKTRTMLRQECDRLGDANEELESQMAEMEGEFALKMKKDSSMIKELQRSVVTMETQLNEAKGDAKRHKADADSLARQALRKGGSIIVAGGGNHGDPNAVGDDDDDAVQLLKDNNQLIQRVAAFQEEVWMLEQAKTVYEGEIQRLHGDLNVKSAVVQAYFADAAQKANGKSFFGPKSSEMQEQQQIMLEKTLAENMKLQEDLNNANHELNEAMDVVREAELQGFVSVVEAEGSLDWEAAEKKQELEDAFS